ncbi:MAG: hypothetical protein AB7I50_03175 [Vicinamibacterales bacterium]
MSRSAQSDPLANRWLTDWFEVVRGEFDEMPGLRLTASQARDYWDAPPAIQHMLDAFVDRGFLARSPEGVYERRLVSGAHDRIDI